MYSITELTVPSTAHSVVGVGLSPSMIDNLGPSAYFTPAPATQYTIKTGWAFYITRAQCDPGSEVTADMWRANPLKIEFSDRMREITVVHGEYGDLTQKL